MSIHQVIAAFPEGLTKTLLKQTKPNVASVINNLLSPFIFSSNLWHKLVALCVDDMLM